MQGWSYVGNSKKAHYFDIPEDKTGGKSLCGKWMLLNANPDWLEDEMHISPDNCASCKRKLKELYSEKFKSDSEEYGYDSW